MINQCEWSNQFSITLEVLTKILTLINSQIFVQNSIKYLRKYNFDGYDLGELKVNDYSNQAYHMILLILNFVILI